jgi:hypothetical protein
MASTFSNLGLNLQATGENSGTWGAITNVNLQDIDNAISGVYNLTITGSTTLAFTTNSSSTTFTDESGRNKTIILSGSLSATTVTITVPNIEKDYVIINNSGGTAVISSGGSTTVSIGTGSKNYVIVDASTTSVISAVPAGSPGGTTNSIQYNSAGSFAGSTNLTFNGTTFAMQTATALNLTATSLTATTATTTGLAFTTATGTTATVTNLTVTTASIVTANVTTLKFNNATGIYDNNGNGELLFNVTGSAVNQFTITNAATANNPTFAATGTDSNIGLTLNAKGTGLIKLGSGGYYAETTLTFTTTIAWDVSANPVTKLTLTASTGTLSAPTNGLAGQFISITVIQDGTGSRTLTWNSAYSFTAATAPTLTTTASQGDLFVFKYDGTKWLCVGTSLNLVV